jgi:ADP-ribosylglycohydrolase/protein-tyrosine phosphatase
LLLAGEFPGANTEAKAREKLGRLVDVGIRQIINLMQPNETDHSGKPFTGYRQDVHSIAEEKKVTVSCQRIPIADLSVPTVTEMKKILDAVMAGMERGEPVYVHCWGGIGRTGTAVGCFLLRSGMATPGDVFSFIANLRKNDPKRHRTSPETETQRQFVINWLGHKNNAPCRLSRSIGCMLGGAAGDALGAPVEFSGLNEIRRLYGKSGITRYAKAYGRKGAITDDTQMALFTADGLLRAWTRGCTKGICNPASVVHHAYVQWLNTQGHESESDFNNSKVGSLVHHQALWSCRAPGNSCLSALQRAMMGTLEKPVNDSKGCGGVMRAAPAGLISTDAEQAFSLGCQIAAITHGHPTGYLTAGTLAVIIFHINSGGTLRGGIELALSILEKQPNHGECSEAVHQALKCSKKKDVAADDVQALGQGWVAEEALAMALLCALVCENDFDKAITLAVNHSGDSDSTGAITGNVVGCILGRQGINRRWTDGLELKDVIQSIGVDLFVGFQDTEHWWEKYPGW